MPVGERSEAPVRVNDSGTGSTTLTVRMQEWLTVPLAPVIVILYFPNRVELVADTCKLVYVVTPGLSVSGF